MSGRVAYGGSSTPFSVTTKQDQTTFGDGAIQTEALYDGFGRETEERQYENGGGYISTATTYDGLGRTATTVSPSRPGDGLNYVTKYLYDALNRPTSVTTADGAVTATSYSGYFTTVTDPAGHARLAQTDAAGRLTAVWEDPGSSPHFNYETTYQYDALNRVTQKSYSDGTSTVYYQYDASGAGYSWGQLTEVWNGNSATQYTSIDPLGRVTASNQQTAGEWYGFTYYYNLAGSLTYETYPSGRGVATTYDAASRASGVTGSYNGFGTTYVSGTWYWPHGPIGYYRLGTTVPSPGGNVWPNFEYNQRLQPSKIYAAIGDSPNSFLFLECYEWGTPGGNPMFGTCPAAGGTSDNGNLLGRISYEGGPGAQSALPSYTASFAYDKLNRLTSANDTGGWSRNFAYDQFGNGWVTGWSGMGESLQTPTANIFNSKNQIGSSPYDAAGNMTALPPGMTFTYDAENRQISESNTGGLSATYRYDGDGQRVEKILSSGQKVVYVYDALGALAAEYDLQNPGTPPCVTCYLTYDHLGSLRLVTDANANVIARHDYIPFGEEIPGGVAGRGSQFDGYDNVNQKFTGKERDSETSLDYFGARYYGAGMGRFLSSDPENAGSDPGDPQSWNGYAYTGNNPLARTDPDGLDYHLCLDDADGNQQCTDVGSDHGFQEAAQYPGAGLTVVGDAQSGAIYATDENGNQVQVGSYEHFLGPGTEAGGLQEDFTSELAVAGVASRLLDAGANLIESALGTFGRRGVSGAAGGAAGGAVEDEVSQILRKATSTAGNQGMQVSSRQAAEQAANEWVGDGARALADRNTGEVVGKISSDGLRQVRYTSASKAQPYINLENKVTGGNLHVRW